MLIEVKIWTDAIHCAVLTTQPEEQEAITI
jgi:hypothetical protein